MEANEKYNKSHWKNLSY